MKKRKRAQGDFRRPYALFLLSTYLTYLWLLRVGYNFGRMVS